MKISKLPISRPLSVQLEITDSCNFQCIHCYNLDADLHNRKSLITNDDTICLIARKLVESNIFFVTITGGEPLVNKPLVKKLVRIFKDNNIKVSLNTNLSLMDENFIDFLKENPIDGILTSCPSINKELYSQITNADIGKFICALQKILSAQIKCCVNIVVSKRNIHDIRNTALSLINLGVKSLGVTPMTLNMSYQRPDLLLQKDEIVNDVLKEILWIRNNFNVNIDILEALPKCLFPRNHIWDNYSFYNRTCTAGRINAAISCNGDMRPCTHITKVYGNILNMKIEEIWKNMSSWREYKNIPYKCLKCSCLNECFGGCRAQAKGITGKWDGEDIWMGDAITGIQHSFKEMPDIDDKSILYVNKLFQFRVEYPNVYLLYDRRTHVNVMVNKPLFDFIEELKQYNRGMGIKEIANKFNVPLYDKHYTFVIKFLLSKNILKLEPA